jgi:hypothetical protein
MPHEIGADQRACRAEGIAREQEPIERDERRRARGRTGQRPKKLRTSGGMRPPTIANEAGMSDWRKRSAVCESL